MQLLTLEQLIRQHIPLPTYPNSQGFWGVLCKVCNDHGRKGKRAGFSFQGNLTRYNCFNCGVAASFSPEENETMPASMCKVLTAFGISEADWNQVLFQALMMRGGNPNQQAPVRKNIEPSEITFPYTFYKLSNDTADDVAQYAIEYLSDRKVKWDSYPFYLAGPGDGTEQYTKWYGRLIIPVYKDNKLIFWQGRDLSDTHQKKYLSPPVSRVNILSGYQHLRTYTQDPLYVVEGWFDAYHLDGVAVFGNKLSSSQIAWLNTTNRLKVIIPDKQGDGHLLARQALDLGWAISTPDIGSCKDVNAAIVKYGELYTKSSIIKHTHTDLFTARSNLGVYCEYKLPQRQKDH